MPTRRRTRPRAAAASSPWARRAIPFALVALTVGIYAQVRHFDFVNWDDEAYVVRNAVVQAGLTWRGIVWAFTESYDPYWHPLTWISHMIDVEIFGLAAGGHHLTNVAFSIANTLVAFFLFRRLTSAVWPSALVAALVAAHPLRVESVAWVAERKDLLSALFLLLTIAAWTRYVAQPGWRPYGLVLATAACGLMAKPMLVTLPVVLLLVDAWPLQRAASLRTLLVDKIPIAALALATGLVTIGVQREVDALAAFSVLPLGGRLANAVVAYVAYLGDVLWPSGLAAFYPHPRTAPAWWITSGAALVLLAITAAVIRARARRYLWVGWAWYLVTLLPVIGLIQSGDQARADRFTYIPIIGLFVMIAWGLRDLAARRPAARGWLAAGAVASVAGCAVAAHVQASYWRDGMTLWTRALAVTDGNFRAHGAVADLLAAEGRYREAIAHYEEAVRLAPEAPWWHNGLGFALARDGQLTRAIDEYAIALRLHPDYADAHNNLGAALGASGRTADAIRHYEAAIRLKPDYAMAYRNLAIALADAGRLEDAVGASERAVRFEPARAEWRYELGVFLYQAGRTADAIAELEAALRLDPGLAGARQALDAIRRR